MTVRRRAARRFGGGAVRSTSSGRSIFPPVPGSSVLLLVFLLLGAVARSAAAAGGGDAAAPGDVGGAPRTLEAREVILPIPGAERLRIENPLGSVTIRAWDRGDALHVVAEKRAPSPEALRKLRVHYTSWASGEVTLDARVELQGRDRSLPLSGSRVDLIVEVPAALQIEAKTFAGDITATGLGAGARLETTAGRIGVRDVRGRVITRQLRGGQQVRAVEGEVEVDGVEGLLELERLIGPRIAARMVEGDIRAEALQAEEIRLSTTTGSVALIGLIVPGGHYDVRSYDGPIRLAVSGAPAGFELRSRARNPVISKLPFKVLARHADRMRAVILPFADSAAPPSPATVRSPADRPKAIVELTSVLGTVVVEALPSCTGDATSCPR